AGCVPVERSIGMAAQIAEGLAKAHDAGITHRDLKPENLMLSQDGFVKILDFGLAKRTFNDAAALEMRTIAVSQTEPGLVFGTVQYMSPEQACGGQLDFRSDQFSFGVVLYELLTGKSAFLRNSAAETLTAILRDSAEPVGVVNPEAPAPLCWVVERCLAKDPNKRYASTRDLARELATIRDRFAEMARPVEVRPSHLPAQRTCFVGREKEVASARELLFSKDVRLVTITGPGGIGKTRLAVQVATELAAHFAGGAHFVPLSSVSDP